MEQSPTTLTVGDLLVQRAPNVDVIGQDDGKQTIRIRGLSSSRVERADRVRRRRARVVDRDESRRGRGRKRVAQLPRQRVGRSTSRPPRRPCTARRANGVIVSRRRRRAASARRWTWTGTWGGSPTKRLPSSFDLGHAPNTSAPSLPPGDDGPDELPPGQPHIAQHPQGRYAVADQHLPQPLGHAPRRRRRRASSWRRTSRTRLTHSDAGLRVQSPRLMKIAVRGEWKNRKRSSAKLQANFNASLRRASSSEWRQASSSDQRFPVGQQPGEAAAARSGPSFAHAGLGYTNVGALGDRSSRYNAWVPSEIFRTARRRSARR